MQPTSDIAAAMPVYGSNATSYREPPSPVQIEDGVIPLDSLPADWWNWLWYNITTDEAKIVSNLGSIFNEIIAVLTAAGKTPSATDSTQLLESIRSLCRVVATTTTRGAVLSSTASGQLAVDSDGKATINDLGTPTSLDTTDKTVVGAINELYAVVADLSDIYAPKSHASSATTYGVGSTTAYGHVMICAANGLSISNGVISMGNATISTSTYPGACCTGTVTKVCLNGTAYTPTSGVVNLGNITGFPGYDTAVPCVAGIAAVGSSILAARGDHIHPLPWCDRCNIAIGCNACAYSCATSIGCNSSACSDGISIGRFTYSICKGIAIGFCANSNCCQINQCTGIAIGDCASLSVGAGIAVGHGAHTGACYGTALGFVTYACYYATAVGHGACATGCDSVAVGQASKSFASYSVAIGDNARADLTCSVAIGAGVHTFACASNICIYAAIGPIALICWTSSALQCNLVRVINSHVKASATAIRITGVLGSFGVCTAYGMNVSCANVWLYYCCSGSLCTCFLCCTCSCCIGSGGCMLIAR